MSLKFGNEIGICLAFPQKKVSEHVIYWWADKAKKNEEIANKCYCKYGKCGNAEKMK